MARCCRHQGCVRPPDVDAQEQIILKVGNLRADKSPAVIIPAVAVQR